MSEDVRSLLFGLDTARDVKGHWQTIDRWVAQGDYDSLEELAAVLPPIVSEAAPQCWQPGSVLDHLRQRLALTPGRRNIALLLTQLVSKRMPDRQLRETAARLADAQESEAIVAALEEYEARGGLAELLYVLTHEAVLRRKIGETTPVTIRLADRMRQEGHPLARLPLRLSGLEVDAPAFLPRYVPHGSSNASAGTSGGWGEGRAEGVVRPGPLPAFREVTTPEMADRAAVSVRTWVERSNGRSEVRLFEFEEPIPARWVGPSILRSLGLECLAEAGEEAVHLREISASQGFGYLFSAAATGGAYTWGEGGAYGRLSAWDSVAALTGCSGGDIGLASAHAVRCSWFSFWTEAG